LIESLLPVIAVILMLVAIAASILPVVPGPALVWAIGLIYAILTNFQQVGVLSLVVMTILMILGSTTGWWMQALGMRAQGGSVLSIIGAMIGGLVGTFAIPMPLVGTLIGIVGGALVFEFLRVRQLRPALRSGTSAATGYVLGILVEGGIALLIVVVFVISVLL